MVLVKIRINSKSPLLAQWARVASNNPGREVLEVILDLPAGSSGASGDVQRPSGDCSHPSRGVAILLASVDDAFAKVRPLRDTVTVGDAAETLVVALDADRIQVLGRRQTEAREFVGLFVIALEHRQSDRIEVDVDLAVFDGLLAGVRPCCAGTHDVFSDGCMRRCCQCCQTDERAFHRILLKMGTKIGRRNAVQPSTSLPEGEGLIFDNIMRFLYNKQNPQLYIYTKNDLQRRSFGLSLTSSL